jgi:CBS domain-containing protein
MNVATILKDKGSGVFTTTSDKSLLEIAKLLARHSVGCIVIVGEKGKIAGIVSERDLMRAIGQAGPKVLDRPVSDFMTKNVVTAREADTSERLMSERDGSDGDAGVRGLSARAIGSLEATAEIHRPRRFE